MRHRTVVRAVMGEANFHQQPGGSHVQVIGHSESSREQDCPSMVAPREGKQAPSGGAGVVLIRMLTVDEHPDIHSSLAILASLDPAFGLVTRPSGAETLIQAVARVKPTIVVIGSLSKKPSVFDSVRDLRVRFPDIRCVFLTSELQRSNLAAAYACGASGFFAKGDDLNEIVDGLKVISSCGQSAFIVGKMAIEYFRTAVGKSEPS